MIKVADKDDLPSIINLLNARGTIMGDIITPEIIKNYIDNFHRYIDNKEIFDSEFLLSLDDSGNIIAGGRQLLLITQTRAWIFSDLITRPGLSYFSPEDNGISEITKYFIDRAESRGFYCYSFIMAAGKNWKNRTHNMRNQIKYLQRYDYYDEVLIPAGTLPTIARYKEMMARRTWNSDLVVRMGLLKNEYRNPSLLVIK